VCAPGKAQPCQRCETTKQRRAESHAIGVDLKDIEAFVSYGANSIGEKWITSRQPHSLVSMRLGLFSSNITLN
jgi:hypothetical protein